MSLSKSDKEYIEKNRGKDPKELADDTGKSVRSIKAFLKTLPEVQVKPKNHFQEHKGTVAMTAAQSIIGDEAPKGTNHAFMNDHRKSIHIIDPDLPVR